MHSTLAAGAALLVFVLVGCSPASSGAPATSPPVATNPPAVVAASPVASSVVAASPASSPSPASAPPPAASGQSYPGPYFLGRADAPLTLEEFGDYQ